MGKFGVLVKETAMIELSLGGVFVMVVLIDGQAVMVGGFVIAYVTKIV
jgi:hypothetical protein